MPSSLGDDAQDFAALACWLDRRSALRLPRLLCGILFAKGRRTETDFINGYVATRGAEIGVPAPTHVRMNEAVRRVERGEAKPSPELIAGW